MKKIFVAAAGAGKTEHIVKTAFSIKAPVLITTFTDENVNEIIDRFYLLYGYMPAHVHILPWYTFVIRYLIKPFQNDFIRQNINGIILEPGQSALYKRKDDVKHYLSDGNRLFSDKIGELACKFYDDFNGFTIENLGQIFDYILIDEMQDMGAYDIELIKLFLVNRINVICVCDPRQSTYKTANGRKNKGKDGINILDSFSKIDVQIDDKSLNTNHRCCHEITKYSDSIYPDFPTTDCDTHYVDDHLGIFFVRNSDINEYLTKYNAYQLTYRITDPYNKNFYRMNIGVSKGKSFNRTLLYLPSTFVKWICKGGDLAPKSRADLYIAITRARLSAAIVYDYDNDFNHNVIKRYK